MFTSIMDEVIELQNMENVCRLCLSTDEPKSSVFEAEESPVSLANKIQACLSIQVCLIYCYLVIFSFFLMFLSFFVSFNFLHIISVIMRVH